MACPDVTYDSSEPLNSDSVKIVLKNYLSTDQFVLNSFNLHPASDSLLGFLGDHFKLRIQYSLDEVTSEVVLFAKCLPRENQYRADFNKQYSMFEREATVYGKIFSQFIQEEDSTAWYPKCYLIMKHDLVFEDLHQRGFQMQDIRQVLDKDYTFVTLTSLARMHAASIILEETKSKFNNKPCRLYEEFKNEISEGCFAYNDWYKVGYKTALLLAQHSNKYGEKTPYYNEVKTKLFDVFKDAIMQCSLSNTSRNVMCHIDMWNNNLMFRHDKNGNPEQCIFVDYQACKFTSPAADILSFIYMNLSKTSRDKYFEAFFIHYYNELSKRLSEYGFKISDIFPWDEFRRSCEMYKKWGLVQSIILFQFMFSDTNEVLKSINDSEHFMKTVLETREYLVEKLSCDSIFCDRMMSNIDDLIQLYIISDV